MKTIILECQTCKKSFERALKEHKRNKGLNRLPYCSRTCFAIDNNHKNSKGNAKSLVAGNRRDEFSPFRKYLAQSKLRRRRVLENNLSLVYLKALWERQNGKCPYLGISLKIPDTINQSCNALDYASLDRIDSSKGYVEGNVQFVSQFMNFAKNKYSHESVIIFIDNFKKEMVEAGDCESPSFKEKYHPSPSSGRGFTDLHEMYSLTSP